MPRQRSQTKTPVWQTLRLDNFLYKVDIFGKAIPTFNMSGMDKVHTMTGGILTCLTVIVILGYAVIKFDHLISKHNPLISEVTEQYIFGSEEKIDLIDIGFKFAWTFEGYLDKKRKDDSSYVKQIVRLYGNKNGEEFE